MDIGYSWLVVAWTPLEYYFTAQWEMFLVICVARPGQNTICCFPCSFGILLACIMHYTLFLQRELSLAKYYKL